MNYHILTLFPQMIMDGLNNSIIGRAIEKGLISAEAVNIRDFPRISTIMWTTIPTAEVQEW